jgi:hypothetical protein
VEAAAFADNNEGLCLDASTGVSIPSPKVTPRMKNDAYEEATRMILHIRELMHGMEQKAEFAAYLAQVRLRYKPKRNLMKLLDREGLGGRESC